MSGDIFKTKVLITVKTYPTLSGKYDELVCTAGITEEGEWIRIYPMPFRKFEDYQQYKKYEWIELDLINNTTDARPETFRPYHTPPNIEKKGHITTGGDRRWEERKSIVLKNIYTDLSALIKENKEGSGKSLGIYKPKNILDFTYEADSREWDKDKLSIIEERAKQQNLLGEEVKAFKIVDKLPYKFKYKFEDADGSIRHIMIEDWELGQLYWNSFYKHKDESKACEDVKNKYLIEFSKKDIYFYMGTTKEFNKRAKNPFIIIGVFYPPIEKRLKLF